MNRPRDDEYDSLRDLMGGDSSDWNDSNEDPADSRRDAVESDELEDLPPGVPPEYADVYRRAYERALRGEEPTDSFEPERPDPVAPAAPAEPEPAASTAEPSVTPAPEAAASAGPRAPAAEPEPAPAAPTVEPPPPARPARDAVGQPAGETPAPMRPAPEAPALMRPAPEAADEEPTRQILVGRSADPKPSQAAATPVPAARTTPEASGPGSKQAPWSSYWGAGDSDEERRKRRLAVIAFVVLALVLVLGAFGLGRLFADNAASSDTGADTDTGSESEGGGEPQQASPYKGAVRAVPIAEAMATCQAGSSVDAAGNPTTYEPAKAIDKNLSTAWRCDGSGAGERFTVTLPEETTVAEVGLVPGYAKTDPASGVDRYAENNRITKVRWRFDDGTTFVQKMNGNPADRSMRTRRLPETATSQVVIEILTSQPGARNTVAISEIRIATPAG